MTDRWRSCTQSNCRKEGGASHSKFYIDALHYAVSVDPVTVRWIYVGYYTVRHEIGSTNY